MLDKVMRQLALNIGFEQASEGLFHLGHHLDSLNKKSEGHRTQGRFDPSVRPSCGAPTPVITVCYPRSMPSIASSAISSLC